MTAILSDKGMIEIPEEFRAADGLKPGQRCDIERVSHGEYRVRLAEGSRPLPLVAATGSPITQTEIDDALDTERRDAPANEAMKMEGQDAVEPKAQVSTSEKLKVFWQLQGAVGLTAEGAAAWKDAVAEARR